MKISCQNKITKKFTVAMFSFAILSSFMYVIDANAQTQAAKSSFSQSLNKKSPLLHNASFSNALEAGKIGKKYLFDKQALQSFYKARVSQPYWLDHNLSPKRSVDTMFKKIEESWTHGLNPYKYHYYEIYDLLDKNDYQSRAKLEVLLTDAFMRYAHDMSGMRIDAKKIRLDASDWKQGISGYETISYLSTRSDNISDTLLDLQPKGKTYKALRKELIRLVNKGPEEYEKLLPIQFEGILKPGWGHKTIPRLREFFGSRDVPSHQRMKYDDDLASAVMRFQRQNGLNPDAIIGKRTLEVINRTTDKKILQIAANMERLRWVDVNDRGNKFVIVNLPSAKVWAIKDGRVSFEMPIIVGRPGRETKPFTTVITGVRLNPDWTVPPTIKRFDIWPKAQQDPNYLVEKGMELFDGFGSSAMTLDPHSIDWENISKRELHSIRMVQAPGDNNPLGRYRILMPNAYNMYLHDTNKPELFSSPDRAQSSGCMRMKYPEKMAEFLLSDVDGWSNEKTESILASYKKTDIVIPEKVPVYVLYYTNWLDDNGRIIYGNDIYGLDKKLMAEIQNIDGFDIPVHNNINEHNSNVHLVSYQQ